MTRPEEKKKSERRVGSDGPMEGAGRATGNGTSEESASFKVEDRRHWARGDLAAEEEGEETFSTTPTIVDEYRQKAEAAEQRLREYIAAFKEAEADREAFRQRLAKDVDRKAELRYAGLVSELLETVDHLDLALSHARGAEAAAGLVDGIAMTRDQFLATLQKHGVERIVSDGEEFDPGTAEAVRVDPVSDPSMDGKVTETLRAGYRLGEVVVRAARVAVGRLESSG